MRLKDKVAIITGGGSGIGHAAGLQFAREGARVLVVDIDGDKARKVAEEIHKMDLKSGPAADAFPGAVKFDENGRRVGAPLVIVQWQNGVPVSIYPTDRALAKAKWAPSTMRPTNP